MCGISNWLAYPKLKKTGDDSDDVDPTSKLTPPLPFPLPLSPSPSTYMKNTIMIKNFESESATSNF